MPSQIIVRVTGLRSVRQLQGKAPVLVVAADGCEALNGETVSFGRQSPTVLLCLNWSRKTGREDAASTLDVPSVLIETRGGKPSVLGLTSCRQDIHGVPNLWRQPFDRYRRILAKAAEHLDHDLMYGQNG